MVADMLSADAERSATMSPVTTKRRVAALLVASTLAAATGCDGSGAAGRSFTYVASPRGAATAQQAGRLYLLAFAAGSESKTNAMLRALTCRHPPTGAENLAAPQKNDSVTATARPERGGWRVTVVVTPHGGDGSSSTMVHVVREGDRYFVC
jgi:hypothetical protein